LVTSWRVNHAESAHVSPVNDSSEFFCLLLLSGQQANGIDQPACYAGCAFRVLIGLLER
jgi:hypothetical protein